NQEYADENLNTILKTLEERAAAGESSLLVTGAREFDAGAVGQRTDSSGEGGMSLEQLVAMDMAASEAPTGSSMSEGGAPESGTAMPAGASEEATGGGGEAAGLGSQELGEGDDGFTRLPSPAENDMILTAAEVDHGARIRMLIATETTVESGATLDAS